MIKNTIKKLLDIICFVGGSCLTIYALMSFNAYIENAKRRFTEIIASGDPVGIAYSYTNQSILYGTVGIGLIVFGFVLRSWYKK